MPTKQPKQAPSAPKNPRTVADYKKAIRTLKIVSFSSLAIGIVAVLFGVVALLMPHTTTIYVNRTINVTQNATFGDTLAGIDTPLNQSQLAAFNDAPDSYFETAGEMYLNGTLTTGGGALVPVNVTPYIVDGKPAVIYYGSTTCIYCGENRWAMALALTRFGSFGNLYNGYSSFGDGDMPTLYWRVNNITALTLSPGEDYSSSYIDFVALEDTGPITGGFQIQPVATLIQEANATHNQTVIGALATIVEINNGSSYIGTPFTVWGSYAIPGADLVNFGNVTTDTTSLQHMTHAQVIDSIADPNDAFAWREYLGADIYITVMCKSLNNTAQVCSLPAIQKMEQITTGY